jgi:hypothetical protein
MSKKLKGGRKVSTDGVEAVKLWLELAGITVPDAGARRF